MTNSLVVAIYKKLHALNNAGTIESLDFQGGRGSRSLPWSVPWHSMAVPFRSYQLF